MGRYQSIGQIFNCTQWTKDLWTSYNSGVLSLPSTWFLGSKNDCTLVIGVKGGMMVNPLDWIMTDAASNISVCPPDLFAKNYVLVK